MKKLWRTSCVDSCLPCLSSVIYRKRKTDGGLVNREDMVQVLVDKALWGFIGAERISCVAGSPWIHLAA